MDGDRVRHYFMASNKCGPGYFCLLLATSFQRNVHSWEAADIMALKSPQGKEGRAWHVKWILRSLSVVKRNPHN